METERLADVDKNIGKKAKDNKKKKESKRKASNFAKEVVVELKKVSWPSKKEVVKATGVVLAVTVVLGGIVGGFDRLFSRLVGLIVGKCK